MKTETEKNETIELTNDFHNTSVRVRAPAGMDEHEVWMQIQADVFAVNSPTPAARAKYNRVRRALCGMSDCTCGIVR